MSYDDTGPDIKGAKRKRTSDDVPYDPMFTDEPVPKPNDLDSEENLDLHERLMSFYQQELDRQEENRAQMAEDEDFYDNEQWSEEDLRVLKDRGQMPTVYNVIATTLDWVLGTERNMRTDFKVLPRRKEGGKPSERKSQLLKYLADVNRTRFDVSRAFADAAKVGVGWLEDGFQDDDEGEAVYSRYESWRYILWDSAGSELDLSDRRYLFRVKWVDEDIACAMFPDRAEVIKEEIDTGYRDSIDIDGGDLPMDAHEDELDAFERGIYDDSNRRRRIRLIECWYRVPKKVNKVRGGDFSGELHDPESPGHQAELEAGRAEVIEKTTYRVNVAIMTRGSMLYVRPSPYRHNRFPFTPVWGKIRGRDNMPYGIIRGLKSIQEDINKRASKALHILSTNKVIADEGAVEDVDETIEEMARPDAYIEVKPNKRFEMNAERELAPAHLDLMARAIQMVQQVGGVTDENLGRQTNASSGKAIEARQTQGALATSGYFDNLRLARQIQGEKQLSLIEQYFTEQKEFRITNMRGTPEYVNVNDGLPENDITRTKADYIISEEDWNATRRQSQTQALLELLQQIGPVAPQVVLAMLDLVVESMDIGSRDELVKRIRAINGQRDPDSEELTPEERERMQQQKQQQEMQMRAAMAEISEKEASAAEKQAKAQKSMTDVQAVMAGLASDNVETQQKALETAINMLSVPQAVPVADSVLHESGFVSRTEQEAAAAQQQQMQAQQQAAEQQAAQEQQAQAQQAAQQQEAAQAAEQAQAQQGGQPEIP